MSLHRFRVLYETIAASKGWYRNVVAFAAGIAALLTLPPLYAFPLLIPGFGALFCLVFHAPSPRRAFFDGWWWGWGFFLSGIYWVYSPFLVAPDELAWLIPVAVLGLPASLALFHGLATMLVWRVRVRGVLAVFVFTLILAGMEFVRGHIMTGFPWNLPGYSFQVTDASAQIASVIGVYGLTWFAILLGAVPMALLDRAIDRKNALRAVMVSYAVFAAATAWGALRLHQADALPDAQKYKDGIMLRLVQPNISERRSVDRKYKLESVQHTIDLSNSPGLDGITHIIWPETAVPYSLNLRPQYVEQLRTAIPEHALLITGHLHTVKRDDTWDIWNRISVFNSKGEVLGTYDKSKLVPFGEYIPLRDYLPSELSILAGTLDYAHGVRGDEPLAWPGFSVRGLICYESIFPELAAEPGKRPELLLSVTNDSWFGYTLGPFQHFHMARLRAVEQGVPFVQVGNTGVTAITDAYGRVLSELTIYTEGVLDTKLPVSLNENTIYNRYNNVFLMIIGFFTVLCALRIKTKKPEN